MKMTSHSVSEIFIEYLDYLDSGRAIELGKSILARGGAREILNRAAIRSSPHLEYEF